MKKALIIIALLLVTIAILPLTVRAGSHIPTYVWVQEAHELTALSAAQQDEYIDNWKAHGVDGVYLLAGEWYWTTQPAILAYANYTDLVDRIQSQSINVYGWVIWNADPTEYIGLADSTNRTNAANAAHTFTDLYGFNGFQDDMIEGYFGDLDDYVTYANLLTSTLHTNLLESGVDLYANVAFDIPTAYAIDADQLCAMVYDSNDWGYVLTVNQANRVITWAQSPAIIGLNILAGSETLSEQLTWLDILSGYSGIAIFNSESFTASDWDALHAYTLDDSTPTMPPTATAPPIDVDEFMPYIPYLILVCIFCGVGVYTMGVWGMIAGLNTATFTAYGFSLINLWFVVAILIIDAILLFAKFGTGSEK